MNKLATILTTTVLALVCHAGLAATFYVGPDGNDAWSGRLKRANSGRPGGIYLDEGSGFIEITANAVYRVPTPMNYNNRAQDRIKTCKEHDNFFHVQPPPQQVVEQAGMSRRPIHPGHNR